MAFIHTFETVHQTHPREWPGGVPPKRPSASELIESALPAVSAIEQFQRLPQKNQGVLLDMACFMITATDEFKFGLHGQGGFWGLYVIGSRARGGERPDSDLDLLSVGKFRDELGFTDRYSYDYDEEEGVFAGFRVVRPDVLPDEYNIGLVERKYIVRATPKVEGPLPIDLSVVDLSDLDDREVGVSSIEEFKNKVDVANGKPLPRVPLVELIVAPRPDRL